MFIFKSFRLLYKFIRLDIKTPFICPINGVALYMGLDFIKFITFNYLTLFALPKTFSFLALYAFTSSLLALPRYFLGSNSAG